jgi:hypothetical protein
VARGSYMAETILRRNLKPTTIVYILCGLVYIGFGLEILGFLLTDKNHQPLFQPNLAWTYLEGATILLTALSPGIALLTLAKVRTATREIATAPVRYLIWIVVVFGVLVSLAESMWTCSGHPTWIQGFPS